MNFPDDEDAVPPERLAELTESLRQQAAEARARPCTGCGAALCGHEALLNVVLGSRHAARCADCLAVEHGESRLGLSERALQWIRRRDCYLHVWRGAVDDGHAAAVADRPSCLFVADGSTDGITDESAPANAVATTPATTDTSSPPPAVAHYDAGQLGCGELVLELRFRIKELQPGDVLRVTAHDPAAPIDLPAWCGLTGHTMLLATHPDYWIRRKEAP